MFKNLCVAALDVGPRLPLMEELRIAKGTGYEGIEIWMEEIVELVQQKSIDHVRNIFSEVKMIPSAWQLPEAWRGDDASYQQLVERLPILAKTGQDLDCKWVFTFLQSFSDERNYQERTSSGILRGSALSPRY